MKKNLWLFIVPFILVFGSVYYAIFGAWMMVFYGISSVVLCTFLPILSRIFKKDTAFWKNIAVELFILFSIFIANAFKFYGLWWYDIVLHFLSGIFIALIVPELIVPDKTARVMSGPQWVGFSIIVGIAAAGFWEIMEFLFDIISGSDAQRNLASEKELLGSAWQNSGIKDTMNDMINGSVGAILGSFINLFSINKRK